MNLEKLLPQNYKKLYEEEKENHAETIREFLKEKKKPVEVQYAKIPVFDVSDRAFIQSMAAISDSDEMTFMLYDLKQQCVENMVNGNIEVNLQMTGIIKGIDLVIKNLSGYKAMWKSLVSENSNVREI
jgi:hypothetical protein